MTGFSSKPIPLQGLLLKLRADASGTSPEEVTKRMEAGQCYSCAEVFSDKNVFTEAGWKETKISGMCEKCWDELFKDAD